MIKEELVEKVAKKTGCTHEMTSRVLEAVLKEISKTVDEGEKVILKNFGVYEQTIRKGRTCFNPYTKEMMDVADKEVVRFRPHNLFRLYYRK